jgi:hypothetical protein
VELAQPLEIPVEVSGGKLISLAFSQERWGVDDPLSETFLVWEEGPA